MITDLFTELIVWTYVTKQTLCVSPLKLNKNSFKIASDVIINYFPKMFKLEYSQSNRVTEHHNKEQMDNMTVPYWALPTCLASTAAVYWLLKLSSVMATSSRMMLKSLARSNSSLRTNRDTYTAAQTSNTHHCTSYNRQHLLWMGKTNITSRVIVQRCCRGESTWALCVMSCEALNLATTDLSTSLTMEGSTLSS